MNWIRTRSTGDDLVILLHFLQTNQTRGPILHFYTRFLPWAEEKLVKPLAKCGPGESIRRGVEVEEHAELGGADGSPVKAEMIEREAENEENVLARGGAVGASAGGDRGEGDGVDISSGTQYEEGGMGAMEEEEKGAESTEDSIGGSSSDMRFPYLKSDLVVAFLKRKERTRWNSRWGSRSGSGDEVFGRRRKLYSYETRR